MQPLQYTTEEGHTAGFAIAIRESNSYFRFNQLAEYLDLERLLDCSELGELVGGHIGKITDLSIYQLFK